MPLQELGSSIAMHIVATRPLSLDKKSVPAEALEGQQLPIFATGPCHSGALQCQSSHVQPSALRSRLSCPCHACLLATILLNFSLGFLQRSESCSQNRQRGQASQPTSLRGWLLAVSTRCADLLHSLPQLASLFAISYAALVHSKIKVRLTCSCITCSSTRIIACWSSAL